MQALVGSGWLWGSVVLSGVFLASQSFLVETVSENRHRSLIRFGLAIAAGLVPTITAVLLAPALSGDIKGLLVAAALGGSGWLVTYLQEGKERATDNGDLMEALRAEIWVQLNDLNSNRHDVTEEDLAGGRQALFFTQPMPPIVFQSVAAEISRLRSPVVDEVVQYYSLLASLRQNAVELRDPIFLARPAEKREGAFLVYVSNPANLVVLAKGAIRALNRALEVPDPDRIDLPAKVAPVNTPGQARSGLWASALDESGQQT